MNDIAHLLKAKTPHLARKVATKDLPNWLRKIMANFDKEVKSVAFELDKRRENASKKAFDMLGWRPRSNEEAIVATAETLSKYITLKA